MGKTVGALLVVAAAFNCAANGFAISAGRALRGYAGVPKPGEEEKTCSFAGVFDGALKVLVGRAGVCIGSSIVYDACRPQKRSERRVQDCGGLV
jgi:hypothetical protein